MRSWLRWLLIASIAITAGLSWKISWAQTAQSAQGLYFPQTGHWVKGEFLAFYQRANNPLLVYGYPITEAFQTQPSGLIVQYFQRARFELHPNNLAGERVQLTPIGEYLYAKETPVEMPIPDNGAGCKVFQEDGKPVCYSFLDFYKANGAVEQFGYPISSLEARDERLVQYFEKARLEWHPEFPSGQTVRLTNLGRWYFDDQGENPLFLRSISNENNALAAVLSLQVRAFPQRAVTGLQGSQTVYAIVRDQNLMPVARAQVLMIISVPGSKEERYILDELTNENGVTRLQFPFSATRFGIATVRVIAFYEGQQAQTVTSFRTWW